MQSKDKKNTSLSRREIMKTALAGGAASSLLSPTAEAQLKSPAGTSFQWENMDSYGEQYFNNMKEIMENIKATEMDLIGETTTRMAQTLRNGGNVFMQAQAGHMGYVEFDENHKGNPGILKSSLNWGGGDYELMKSGDVLMTNYVNEEVMAAKNRGVYVIGVPVNYVDNEWTPEGFAHPNVNGWHLKDVSNVILQSYIPYTQGIVNCPQIPEMKICPSAANSLNTLFWMYQAEVANKFKNNNAKAIDKSLVVLDTVLDRITKAYTRQKDTIFETAETVAKKIIEGAHYHTTSDHPGVQYESNGVAMGPMLTNAWRRWDEGTPHQYVQVEEDMREGDVHLMATIEPDSPKIIEETKRAKDTGMFVIAIAPSNSTEIKKQADVFIDNLSPEGGGLLDIDGFDEKIGTVGGVLNNWLAWIFTAQFIDEMVKRGHVPWFWMGWYQIGGRPYDDGIRPFFIRQGY